MSEETEDIQEVETTGQIQLGETREVERKSVTLDCLNDTLRSLNETLLRLSALDCYPAGTIPNLTENIDSICNTIRVIAYIDALGRNHVSGRIELAEDGPLVNNLRLLGIRYIRT